MRSIRSLKVLRAEENSALNGDAAERAAEELAKRSRLDENVLLHALGQGEVLFEAALAKLSGLAIKMTRRLVYQLGGEGLAVACRSMGLSATNFAKIYRLTRRRRSDSARCGSGGYRSGVRFL